MVKTVTQMIKGDQDDGGSADLFSLMCLFDFIYTMSTPDIYKLLLQQSNNLSIIYNSSSLPANLEFFVLGCTISPSASSLSLLTPENDEGGP